MTISISYDANSFYEFNVCQRVYLSGCAAKNETLDEFRDNTHEY